MTRKAKAKSEDKPIDLLEELNAITPLEQLQIPTTLYKVKVTCPRLNIRRAPSLQAEVVGLIEDEGIYEILDEVNGWGKLKDDNWIMLSYTQII